MIYTFRRDYTDTLDQSVSYEEIMAIVSHRHDYERFGDSDTY